MEMKGSHEGSLLMASLQKDYSTLKDSMDVDLSKDIQIAARKIAYAMNVEVPNVILPPYVKIIYTNFSHVRTLAITLIMVLTFFERPWWCYERPNECARLDVYMNSGIPFLPFEVTDVAQLVCLGWLLFDLFLRYKIVGKAGFSEGPFLAQAIVIVISLADTAFALFVPAFRDALFFSPFLRPFLFVLMFATVRATMWQIIKIIPIIFELLVLLLLLLITAAWFGLILFFDQEHLGRNYFGSFGDALLNLFIFLTTANSPDVRMPVYYQHRSSVIFFIVYLVIGLYFILPFIFSTVYNNYKTILEQTEQYYVMRRKKALLAAFHQLARGQDGLVDLDWVAVLLVELGKYSSKISMAIDERSQRMIAELDADHDGKLDEYEFLQLFTNVLHLQIAHNQVGEVEIDPVNTEEEEVKISATKRTFHYLSGMHNNFMMNSPFCRKLRAVIFHPYFEYSIDVLLVLNGVFFAFQTYFFVTGRYDRSAQWHWSLGEWFFTLLWTLEMVAKMFLMGLRGYASNPKNLFDATITIIGLLASVLSELDLVGNKLVRIIMIFRSLRLLRLFSRMKKFRMIFATLIQLIPIFIALLGVLVFQYYVFGLIGIRLFGGLLNTEHPMLHGTAYEAASYFPNNFNDFGSTCVTLFDLMVINNWFIYMDAVALVTNEASRIYFFLFWFFTNLLTLNLLVANILDAVSNQLDKIKDADAAANADEAPVPRPKSPPSLSPETLKTSPPS
jgi:two pore calcium channel protein